MRGPLFVVIVGVDLCLLYTTVILVRGRYCSCGAGAFSAGLVYLCAGPVRVVLRALNVSSFCRQNDLQAQKEW